MIVIHQTEFYCPFSFLLENGSRNRERTVQKKSVFNYSTYNMKYFIFDGWRTWLT